MIIEKVQVKNFRSILDESICCEKLTVLVGPNGSGKSAFLKALEFFYDLAPSITEDDFYAHDTQEPIEITITFSELTGQEKGLFNTHGYLINDKLTVIKRISWQDDRVTQKYYGMQLQLPVFREIRESESATDKRRKYQELRQRAEFSTLPSVSRADDIEPALQQWEATHVLVCKPFEHEHQFFGWKGPIDLRRYTRFIPIPAVKEASEEATEATRNVLKELMELVVRSALDKIPEIEEQKRQLKEDYKKIMNTSHVKSRWESLEKELSDTLKKFVPDCDVKVTAEVQDIDVSYPKARVWLVEDAYPSTVERSGHGLQRAFIMTLLQYFAFVRGKEEDAQVEDERTNDVQERPTGRAIRIVIGLEEPEIYQHPSRQRHFATLLSELAQSGIPGADFQIIYSTHSPLFVDIDRFNSLRLFRKEIYIGGKPKVTKVSSTSLQEVASLLDVPAQDFGVRLLTIMTPWINEGFFADLAVLVEGIEDRSAIIGAAEAMGYDLEGIGVSVIPCYGKPNLDRPFAIFKKLGVSTYVVFDGDHHEGGNESRKNRKLLRLLGEVENDWPETTVRENYACFKTKLIQCLKEQVGENCYSNTCQHCYESYFIHKDQALKTPVFYKELISRVASERRGEVTIVSIVEKIVQRVKKP